MNLSPSPNAAVHAAAERLLGLSSSQVSRQIAPGRRRRAACSIAAPAAVTEAGQTFLQHCQRLQEQACARWCWRSRQGLLRMTCAVAYGELYRAAGDRVYDPASGN